MPAPPLRPFAVSFTPEEIEIAPHVPPAPLPMPAPPCPPVTSSVPPSAPESDSAWDAGTSMPAASLPETRLFVPANFMVAEVPDPIATAGTPSLDSVESTRFESVTISHESMRHDTSPCVFVPLSTHSPEMVSCIVPGSYAQPSPENHPTSTPFAKTCVIMWAAVGPPSTVTAHSWPLTRKEYSPSGRYT